MLQVAFYTASICKLPWLDTFQQHLCFFGQEKETKRDILVRVTHFEPFLLLLPNQEDFLQYGNEGYLQFVAEELYRENPKIVITKISTEQRMQTQHFTGEKLDHLLKLHFTQEWHRKHIYDYIAQHKKFGNINIQHILHDKERQILQAMHHLNIVFHTWYQIPTYHPLSEHISFCDSYEMDSHTDRFEPNVALKNEQVNLNTLYIRGFAFSSVATRHNLCVPNVEVDPIQCICFQINRLPPVCLTNNNEQDLLSQFYSVLHQSNIHVVIYSSDELLKPNIVHYIHIRAQKIGSAFHWTKIRSLDYSYETEHGNRYLQFPGLEFVDVAKCLQKAYCQPPIAEYTLLHLIRHPKLIAKDTKRFGTYYNPKYLEDELFGTFYNPNYEAPNQFDSMDVITTDMMKQVQIMSKFVEQSGTLPSLLTVSATCDMEPKNVMNRGQSFRVMSVFYRDLYDNQLYFDEFNVKRPTVLLPIKREDSSFPDPPWLTNPDIHELMDYEQKQKKTKMMYPTRETKRPKKQEEEIEKPNVVSQETLSGGLVLKPIPGYWKLPIWTLDWASMYPNIIIAFRICTMTLIRDSKWLQDPDVTLQYIPRTKTHCDVRVIAYKGKPVRTFLPAIVARFLKLREDQRTLKQNAKTKEEELARAMAELAMKTSANACYGFFGARTSPMCSFAIASAVTQIGQHMQKTVRHRILSHRNPDLYEEREPHLTGGAVLYGDTDSCMACFPISKKITDEEQRIAESKKQAKQVTDYCTQYFKGNTIIVESIKNPLWMLPHKKTYVCIENGKEKMKGIGSIKRDKCGIAREVGVTTAHNILYNIYSHPQQHCDWLKTVLDKVPFGIPPHYMALEMFILSAQLKDNYRADTALALEVALKIEMETGNKPAVNDRLSFVFAYMPDEKMHAKKAYPPSMFLKRKLQLDCEYYFEKQIFGCLKQLLSLPMHTTLLNQLHVIIRSYISKWKVYCMMQDARKKKY